MQMRSINSVPSDNDKLTNNLRNTTVNAYILTVKLKQWI